MAEIYKPNYTYNDYCHWEGRWELIDGIPYSMFPNPDVQHQTVVGNILYELHALIKGKPYKVYPTIDWVVEANTVIQPDLLIVDRSIEKDFLDFPPVVVAEILSSSTAVKDRNIKMEIYQCQQVKYYIIADPENYKLEIYELNDGAYQLVAVSPDSFFFQLDEDCCINVNFKVIWD